MTAVATEIGLSPVQLQIYDARETHRFRVAVTGRRVGKTHEGCVELFTAAAEKSGSDNWAVFPTYRMAKRIAWRMLKRIIPWPYIAEQNESELLLILQNGSRIELKGCDNPDSLRGSGLDHLWMDEFAYSDRDAWTEVLRPMLSDREGSALFTTTPHGFNWAYDMYLRGLAKEPGWRSFMFTTLQGGRVAPEEIEAARHELDPRVFSQEYEASFEHLSGRVYGGFSREPFPAGNVDDSVTDTGAELLVGMDFNVHPMTAVIAVKAGDECHVLDVLEVPTSNTEEVAQEIRRRYPKRRVIVCPDPSGKSRKTSAVVGVTDFTILRDAGFEVRAPGAAPAVVDRINNTNAMLCTADMRRRTRIHPRAVRLIRALDGMTYKDGTSIPDKSLGLDHLCDALGYLLFQEFNVLMRRRVTVGEMDH